VKYAAGGLIDLDFMAQYLLLRHAHDHPELIANNSVDIFARAGAAGLLDKDEADRLIAARRRMHEVQGVLRLAMTKRSAEEELPQALREMLARMTGEESFDALRISLAADQDFADECFERMIENLAKKEEVAS
jgi:glutamate-ammonia-ligase adenylyltransferase